MGLNQVPSSINPSQNTQLQRQEAPGALHESIESLLEKVDTETELERAERKEGDDKRVKNDKSRSVALATDGIKLKDLVEESAEKFAKLQKDSVRNKLEDDLKEFATDLVREESLDLPDDIVRISANVNEHKKEDLQKILKAGEKQTGMFSKNAAEDTIIDIQDTNIQDENLSKNQQRLQEDSLIKQKLQKNQIQGEPRTIEESIDKFVTVFAESLVKEDPKKKQEAQLMRTKLKEMGMPTKKLVQIEENIKHFVQVDLKKQIKKSFIEVAMSYTPKKMTQELANHYSAYEQLLALGEETGILPDARKLSKDIMDDSRSEMRDFITQELDRSLVETRLKSSDPRELVKIFNNFNNIAGFVKFNPDQYMRTFRQKMDDLGLSPFINPNQSGHIDTQPNRGQSDGRKKSQQELIESIESTEDQLRALFVKQYTASGFINGIKMRVEILKLTRELQKAGKGDDIATLKKESVGLAKFKLTFLLRESFEERATLLELKGPKYTLSKKKMKTALKGLKSLGFAMSRQDIRAMRDQANRAMFTLVKEEYIKLEIHFESNPNNPQLASQVKGYFNLLNRLKKESNIQESIKPKLMEHLDFLSDINIVEAA